MSSPRLFCSPRYSAVYIFSFVCYPGIECRHLSIYLAGCYPAFSSSCSRDFSSPLSSVRTSPRIAPVPPSVPACPPISAGISARSVLPCTPGSSTRLLVVFLSGSQSVLSILLSYSYRFILFFSFSAATIKSQSQYPFVCLSFFVECSSSQGRVFFRCSVRTTSVSAFFSMLIVSDVIRLIPDSFPSLSHSHLVRIAYVPVV